MVIKSASSALTEQADWLKLGQLNYFSTPTFIYQVRGNPLTMPSNETGLELEKRRQNGDFRQINRYISETVEDRHTVTMSGSRIIGLTIDINFDDLKRPCVQANEDRPMLSAAKR